MAALKTSGQHASSGGVLLADRRCTRFGSAEMVRVVRLVLLVGLMLSLVTVPAVGSSVRSETDLAVTDGPLVLTVGDGPSSGTIVAADAGLMVLGAETSGAPTTVRTLTGASAPGTDSIHSLSTDSPADVAASLTWQPGVRQRLDSTLGTVPAGGSVVRTLTPTAQGPMSFTLDWMPTTSYGQVTRTASGGVVASSSAQALGAGAPDLFTVSAPGTITGVLSWPSSTVPPRNLDLQLNEFGAGEVAVADDLLENPERIDFTVPTSVDHDNPRTYGFTVKNRGTESHQYTLGWAFPVTADVTIELIDPDGDVIDVAGGRTMSETVSTTVATGDVGREYAVRITSNDHEADYEGAWTSIETAYADVLLTLRDVGTGEALAEFSDDDGDLELTHRLDEGRSLEFVVRNQTSGFGATTMPGYALEETVVRQQLHVDASELAAGETGSATVPVAAAGPVHVELDWAQSSVPAQLQRTTSLIPNGRDVQSFEVTGQGAISATLGWVEPRASLRGSAEVRKSLTPTFIIPVPIERTGTIDASVSALQGAGLRLELLNESGSVVASATQSPTATTASLSYDVPTYTDGQPDYTLRVSITELGLGGDFDVTARYPVTADLGLELRRDGAVVATAPSGNPTTVTYNHLGAPATYELHTWVGAHGVPQFDLAASYPSHAAVMVTVTAPDDSVVAAVTDDDGTLTLDTSVPDSGGYTIELANQDQTLDVPGYLLASFAPAGPPIGAQVTVTDGDGTVVADVDTDIEKDITFDVVPGTYTVTANSSQVGTVALHTLLEPHDVLDDPDAVFLDMADPGGAPAAQVAAAYGVTPTVASEMIIWQGYVNDQMKPLIDGWGDRYVYSTFLDPVDGVMPHVVYLIAPTPADEAAVAAMSNSVGDAHVVETTYTRDDVQQALDAAATAFQATAEYAAAPDDHYDFEFDYATGTVTRFDRGATEPTAECRGESEKTGGRLDGGRRFLSQIATSDTSCKTTYSGCTTGFSATFSGKQGALTAGHCMLGTANYRTKSNHFIRSPYHRRAQEVVCRAEKCNNSTAGIFNYKSYAATRSFWARLHRNHDLGMIREKYAGTAPSSNIYIDGPEGDSKPKGYYQVRGYQREGAYPSDRTVVCHTSYGNTNPGQYCGVVTDWEDYGYLGTWASGRHNFTQVEMFSAVDRKGASGGPFYRYSYNGSLGRTQVIGMGMNSSQSTKNYTTVHYYRVGKAFEQLDGLRIFCAPDGRRRTCSSASL